MIKLLLGESMLNPKSAGASLAILALAVSTTVAADLRERVVSSPVSVISASDFPVAVSVLDTESMSRNGITSLADLIPGQVAPLKVQPSPLNASNLYLTIRGIGGINADQPARDPNVGVYLDGVYLARSQGLGFDIIDAERIEILRGPQGVLYGRNTLGGAVNIVSKKPSGELDFSQQFTLGGEYNEFKSITHLDLPRWAGFSTKLSYLANQHDGWVDNLDQNDLPERNDFWAKDNEGLRLAINWSGLENLVLDYSYEDNSTRSTQAFFQDGDKFQSRATESFYLPESEIDIDAHTLTAQYTINDRLAVRSISAVRDIEELSFFNFGEQSTLARGDLQEQDQLSQELQLVGSFLDNVFDFVVGALYFEEDIEIDNSRLGTNNPDGFPIENATIVPFQGGNGVNPATSFPVAEFSRSVVDSELESTSFYGYLTWHVQDWWDIQLGVRDTKIDRDIVGPIVNHDQPPSGSGIVVNSDADSQQDYLFALHFQPNESTSAYLSYTTSHRPEGASLISETGALFKEETADNIELGVKAAFGQRARVGAAVFYTEVADQQLEFASPENAAIVEIVNANDDSQYQGFELDASVAVIEGLEVGFQYSYLDSDIEPFNSPFGPRLDADIASIALAGGSSLVTAIPGDKKSEGDRVNFRNAQAPRHSGVFSFDYQFPKFDFGTMDLNIDVISASRFAYSSTIDDSSSRDIVNARLTVSDIELEEDSGTVKVSLWGKNVRNDDYLVNVVDLGGGNLRRAYGEPRTYGVDVLYEF